MLCTKEELLKEEEKGKCCFTLMPKDVKYELKNTKIPTIVV
jgi:hypothetical protein